MIALQIIPLQIVRPLAIAMPPVAQVGGWVALLLSGLAILFVILASRHLQAIRREALGWEDLVPQLLQAEQLLAKRLEPQLASDTVLPASERLLPAHEGEIALTPAEVRSLEVQDRLDPFRAALEGWIGISGVDRVPFRELLLTLDTLSSDLVGADFSRLDEIEAAFSELQPALLQTLLSRTDRDLDPERGNPPLQAALGSLLTQAGLVVIDPGEGAVVNRRLHMSMGVLKRGAPEQRGTVGVVRCRGLQTGQGVVLLKAEILEFD